MRTHYEGCWRAPGHHDCAIAMIESLLIENDSWERAVTEARGEAHEARGNVRKLQEAIMPLTLSRDICVDLLERAPKIDHRSRWRCRCDCGTRRKIIGGGKSGKTTRIAQAFDAVFRPAPDYVHVDTPGARVVRGSRY